jgi:hypothetical protein
MGGFAAGSSDCDSNWQPAMLGNQWRHLSTNESIHHRCSSSSSSPPGQY